MYWFPGVDATADRRACAEATLAAARLLAPDAPETHFAQGEFAYRCNDDWQERWRNTWWPSQACPMMPHYNMRSALHIGAC